MSDRFVCWLQSSLRRVYPMSPPESTRELSIQVARGERCSFQACFHSLPLEKQEMRISVEAPEELSVQIRRVGYVPMWHHNRLTEPECLEGVGRVPGLVPDPLFPQNAAVAGPMESHAFWVTIRVPTDAVPGERELSVILHAGNESSEPMRLRMHVAPAVISPTSFPVAHWFYADAICDWHRVAPYEERAWSLIRPYIEDVIDHGSSCLYVPIFTPPTDGVKRPHQLLRVRTSSPGRWEFDFSDVKRWVDMGLAAGAQYFEWTHFFTQWGARQAIRVYRNNADPSSLLWPPETPATSQVYRGFLAQFLPAFRSFLDREDLLNRSFFHVSDEPQGEDQRANYRLAREMLRELAPWMRVMDAVSEIDYAREGLTDMPIPSIRAVKPFHEADIPCWVYYCCGPRGPFLSRQLDTPLANIRMHGFLFYKLGALGFLHWGYNYWYRRATQELVDPFTEQAACSWPDWAYGDTFVVYPGEHGPIDSIRWEVFAEAIQDYALLETVGLSPEDPLLEGIKAYDGFPVSEDWIGNARRRLLGATSR